MFSPNLSSGNTGNDFAYINNGKIIINGIDTFQETSLQVYDVLGNQLFSQQLSTLNSQLSTKNFPAGIYVLQLKQGDIVKTQKIVID